MRENRLEVRDLREKTITILSDSFAEDLIDIEEYEERVELAHKAKSGLELKKLVADLVRSADGALVPQGSSEMSTENRALASRKGQRTVVAVLGGVERKGKWDVPAKLRTVTVLGGAELDFREAELPPGETVLQVITVLGGVEVLVPPNVRVECEGTAILGGFEIDQEANSGDPNAPLLRITGVCVLGGVQVQSREAGESKRQARRRRKKALRAAKKAKALKP